MTPVKIWLGYPYPLGATWLGNGVNFAIFSESATSVDLCLFDRAESTQENIRIPMTEHTDQVWHLFLPDMRPGQLYGYRVYGPYDPERGMRFNSSKLLLDPYAKAIAGTINWADEMFGYVVGSEAGDLTRDFRDDARGMPKAVVIDSAFDWGGDKAPRTALNNSIIYEAHVKGFTRLCPNVPEELRGTYAGMGSAAAIKYLTELGATAVELLPVHSFVNDKILVDKGLTNYWGYNSIGFFAPEARYASSGSTGGQVSEFKGMVRNLHAAGIEVILDVVYNHTGEGNHLGPTLSFRGIDNHAYYWLSAEDQRFYMDFTGTGNTFNLLHPRTLQLVMDSLRYWVQEMHVDGFRFDLASTLARDFGGVNKLHAFFEIIHQDPVLSQVKLIAEPWDVGEGGYQVGNFPVLWAEWNGKYRDAVRSFWKGDESRIGEMAYRLTGSPDLYQHNGRRPYASINFITAHDGFTLNDLVSYNDKHNEANGENNNDGDNNNHSWNHGVEGVTDDGEINALRAQQRRNLLATLLLSQGVPMLCAGDEWARTQNGNNNAYCQDNEISWLSWDRTDEQEQLLKFTKKLIKLRHDHPVFRRPKFFQGRRIRGSEIKDVMWFNSGGSEMSDEEWSSPFVRCLGMLLSGDTIDVLSFEGEPIRDQTFLLLINAHYETIPFVLPGEEHLEWRLVLDTVDEQGFIEDPDNFASGDDFAVEGRATKLLRLTAGSQAKARHESWKKRQIEVPQNERPEAREAAKRLGRGKKQTVKGATEGAGEETCLDGRRAVIFDLDGTLVDSNDLHVEAWREAFRHYGKDFSTAELRRQIGKGGDKYLPEFLTSAELREFGPELEQLRGDLFKRKYLERVRTFPKVRELFERLREDRKRIALASSGNADEVEHYVKLAGIGEMIDARVSKDEVEHSKPSPDVFTSALHLLHLPPQDAIAIGDTPYDVEAAKKIELRTIGFLCGGFPEDALRASGAIAIFRDPADLLESYARSPLCG